jgi:uncharacterized protein (DUF736 family)
MGINIGFFKAVNGGYEGKITTLLHNLSVAFERVLDRTSENQPAFRIYSGELQIGAAWEKKTKKSKKPYISVNLEDPTFSNGFYSLWRNDGVQDGYTLVYERPSYKPSVQTVPAQEAA